MMKSMCLSARRELLISIRQKYHRAGVAGERENIRWVIGRAAGVCGYRFESDSRQIKLINKEIDHSGRVFLGNIIIQLIGK